MKKVCGTCAEEKTLSEFRKDRSRKDGHSYTCKVCARLYHKSAYQRKYGEKLKKEQKQKRLDRYNKIQEYKEDKCCIVCSENDPVCLEFHHIDPSTKKFGIANGLQNSWDKILLEIEKCVLLCSNCHKKLHAGKIKLEAVQGLEP